MPANASRFTFRPKREFKRGFWWTLGAVFAYALIGGGAYLAVWYASREGASVTPLGQIESGDSCVTGACPDVWAR